MSALRKSLILLGMSLPGLILGCIYESFSLKNQLNTEIINIQKATNEKLRTGSVRELFDSSIYSVGRILIIEGKTSFHFPNPSIKRFDSVCTTKEASLSSFSKITLCRSLLDQRAIQILSWQLLFLISASIFFTWKFKKECDHQKVLSLETLKSQKLLHDLNGPLTTIRVLTSQNTYENELLDEAYRSIRTILSKDKVSSKSGISLFAVIARLRFLYPNVNVEINSDDPLATTQLTPHQERIVFNIAQNACEAIDVNNSVKIQTAKTLTGRIRVTITDKGPGIPKHIIRKICHGRVPTTKANGTGLGLFSAKSSAAIVNASIRFRVSKNGTTAFITL